MLKINIKTEIYTNLRERISTSNLNSGYMTPIQSYETVSAPH